ncbi:MAG: amidohydrolase family protein [Proteobacteria bacterium]|nr:amidohydrolase family protein [Pseudomonadota bacterium]
MLLITLVFGACSKSDEGNRLLIENVNVVDPVSGLLENQQVLIENGVITAVVGSEAAIASEAKIERFNAAEQYLVPGLWDMHVHFVYEPSLTDAMADLFLDYGITSVRDTGGDIEQLAQLRDRLPAPKPNIYLSGPLLDGRFVVYDGSDVTRPPLGTYAGNASTASETVAALQQAGADFIKIYELVQPATYDALVQAARSRSMPIASHVPLMMTADTAGPNADSMEHLRNLELACAANWQELLNTRQQRIRNFTEGLGYALRAGLHQDQRLPAIAAYDEERCNQVLDTLTNTIQVPTLRLNTGRHLRHFERPDWPDALAKLPEETQRTWQAQVALFSLAPAADPTFAQWSLFLMQRLLQRGVPIGAGTDAPIGLAIPGYSLHTELELLVVGGMTAQQALAAATVTPARFFNKEDSVGRIRPGMRADLLLLAKNPLDDIKHTRGIKAVMLGGDWVR